MTWGASLCGPWQDAAELRVQDIPKSHGGIIAVSQSGETRDVLKGSLTRSRNGSNGDKNLFTFSVVVRARTVG